MRWESEQPRQSESMYDAVCRIGGLIEEARGLELADEWPNLTRDWILERDPIADPSEIGFTEVLEAFRALGFIRGAEE